MLLGVTCGIIKHIDHIVSFGRVVVGISKQLAFDKETPGFKSGFDSV